MTREEMIDLCGNKEQADFAEQIVLKNVTRNFVQMCINAELGELNNEIALYVADGIIYKSNGSYQVNWSASDKVYGDEPGAAWKATEEQKAEAEQIEKKCADAAELLYRRNRTVQLLAVR